MTQITDNIYVGNETDYHAIQVQSNWAILHCCKNPFHCELAGYRGNLNQTHPHYKHIQKDNRMALNLVDMDTFNSAYLDFNKTMFEAAFTFLNEYRTKGYKLLIHCNQGESRGPTMAMLYCASLGVFNYLNFEATVALFRTKYPPYNPKKNIFFTVQNLWKYFVDSSNVKL